MPSKELIEKVATVLNEQEGCYFQPQDYHRGAAKEIISTIFAALQEPTEGMIDATGSYYIEDKHRDLVVWNSMLAASALGEQGE